MGHVALSSTPSSPGVALNLPPIAHQARSLLDHGLVDEAVLRDVDLADAHGAALLAVHPDLLPASRLAPLLALGERRGFVVTDMTDVDDFTPQAHAAPPDGAVYLVSGLDRGDAMRNWSPDEALPAILGAGRTPLTLTEGILWVLQDPTVLERNHCFMTIGSRLSRADGTLDARTPALWISNGTGRDGRERRGCPKVGWCWAGNRHTWLGFASAERRLPLP